jgi:hypothetical protein
MIALFRARGIEARRVNLVDDRTGFAHTAVVYDDDGEWLISDTAFSTPDFATFADTNSVPFDELIVFDRDPGGGALFRSRNALFSRYNYFDLSRVIRGKAMLVLTDRPPYAIALLLENPDLFKAVLSLLVSLACFLCLWILDRMIRSRTYTVTSNGRTSPT